MSERSLCSKDGVTCGEAESVMEGEFSQLLPFPCLDADERSFVNSAASGGGSSGAV